MPQSLAAMWRSIVLLVTLTLMACARSMQHFPLPTTQQVEEVPFFRGVSSKAQLDGYLVPSVKSRPAESDRRAISFTIEKQGHVVTSVRCVGIARGGAAIRELACAGDGFDLTLKETGLNALTGTFRRKELALTLKSVSAAAQGGATDLAGFHVYRDAKWVASFECFWGGRAYFSPTLSPLEREAAAVVAVAVVGTEAWLSGTNGS